MARLFIAFELPEYIKDELRRLQDQLQVRFASALRFVPRDNFHLTLKFLGNTSEERITPIVDALRRCAANAVPFSLRLADCGVFPPHGKPKIIWTGSNDRSELTLCHHLVETTCAALGYEREIRPFTPHITLARVAESLQSRDLRPFSEQLRPLAPEFSIDAFALFDSRTTSAGAHYEVIERVRICRNPPE